MKVDNLKEYCTANTEGLFNLLGERCTNKDTYTQDRYLYLDRGDNSRVLFVAHLDTVNDFYTPVKGQAVPTYYPPNFEIKQNKVHGEWVRSIALDDRLGVWAGLCALPQFYDIECDVLLTLDEEIGQSTASQFKTDKQYNWIFQFDRHDLNPVLYQYDTDEMRERLHAVGYDVSHGTFSDICSLDHLGVSGINFGIGYQNEHSKKCSAYVKDFKWCLDMFSKFYAKYKDTLMPYTPPPRVSYAHIWDDERGYFPGWGESESYCCILCGGMLLPDERQCCVSCAEYLDTIDHKQAGEFLDNVLYESPKIYSGYCDSCSCDLELTEDDMHKDFIFCDDCSRKFIDHSRMG